MQRLLIGNGIPKDRDESGRYFKLEADEGNSSEL
jgi:hypothetical protein